MLILYTAHVGMFGGLVEEFTHYTSIEKFI